MYITFPSYTIMLAFVFLLSCTSAQQKNTDVITDTMPQSSSNPQLATKNTSDNRTDTFPKSQSQPIDTTLTKPVYKATVSSYLSTVPDTGFVELIRLDSTFILDMRYATPANFLKEKVYDCDKCMLRKEAALALIKAQTILRSKGYRLRLFDCYRPLDVQKKMWKIMPNDHFVGNPYGNGSMHNKGAALDLTLADSTGKELDMGTSFDFFGKEAYHAYTKLPADVLERRRLLKQTMIQAGFSPITSEWWHYSYKGRRYKVANFKPNCDCPIKR